MDIDSSETNEIQDYRNKVFTDSKDNKSIEFLNKKDGTDEIDNGKGQHIEHYFFIIGTVTGYNLKCPAKAEWRLRADVSCYSDYKYVCLFHLLRGKYEESCLGSDQSSIGSKLVFQPLFNLAECNARRFQPIVFTTHGNSECILRKSKCSEEGQVVYSNGSSSIDIACRCDYTRGYAHVSKPQNSCFCIPSEEDCSCFRVNCTKLSPDYQCITGLVKMVNTKCREIHPHTLNNTQSSTVQIIDSYKKSFTNAHHVTYIIIASTAVYIVLALLTIYVFAQKSFIPVPPIILSQETIETDGRIILKCYVRSYIPLTSVIWYKGPGENICSDAKSNNVCSSNGMRTLTFESSVDYDITTYTCRASNLIGAVESIHVQLYDEERQQFIHELFKKGECGKLHFARLVLIGKNGVGKTSLMRRLLWQNKGDVTSTQSTDGIEVEKCNINIKDGKWSKCDKIEDALTRLIHQVYTEKNLNEESAAAENVVDEGNFGSDTHKSRRVSDNESFDESIDTDSFNENIYNESSVEIYPNRTHINSIISDNIDNDHDNETVETDLNQIRPEKINFQNEYDDKINSNETESDQVNDDDINQMTSTIMKTSLQFRERKHNDMMAFCWLWDFAGQKDFYATHQVFLSKCAVYLLVTDSLHFTTAEEQGIDFEDSAQYVRFWFDAIHCYWSTSKKGRLDPPIIVVCTNEDKFKEPSERQKRREQFQENLSKVLKNQKKKSHLRNVYFVSNTEDNDNVFEEIRNDISRQAMDMKDWGTECPLKWLLFQQVLGKLKDSGLSISTTTKLSKIAKHDDIGITNDEQFKLCLQYCHANGTIIYFEEENLQDYVILDPKWLVDAFRCLVSDKIENVIKISDHWQNLTETGELTDKLITDLFKKEPKLKFLENKSHLLEVMKRFDIIVNLKNSTALYMPCMMKPCTFEEIRKQFIVESPSFYRTSWLCLDFEFLPPAFFNHILAWYIRQYSVSVLTEKGTRYERKALYRQIGVFDLDLSGCEQLVVCEGPNVIALQIWNSRIPDNKYVNFRTNLCQFVDTLLNRYRLTITFTKSFKCRDGDFTINRKKMNILRTEDYRCLEHKTHHISEELVQPWYVGEEIQ
ncbi:unnamed protein product [Mytilus coruscus]|uniref:Ig-like domain-containing protein n=1 Tax=Mytilus coruscus TaxID=42192 RepID=A0A6J7ZWK0_MYTCO|nr:unnamed protein product [Mytilus coruscus]